MGSRILITGAAGFLGATFAHYADRHAGTLGLFVRHSSHLARLDPLSDHCTLMRGDLRDAASLAAAVAAFRPDCVVHCASTLWFKSGQQGLGEHFEVNATGTLHLLDICRKHGVKLVFTGSSSVYGMGAGFKEDSPLCPTSVYAVSKIAASELLQLYARQGLPCVELRIFAPYGPLDSADRLIQIVVAHALSGTRLELTSGRQKRDWVYAEDVAEALWMAATSDLPAGSVLNIAGGHSVSVKETVELLLSLVGAKPGLAVFGARPDRSDEIYDNGADIARAWELLRWKPQTPLADGLARTVAWIREHADTAGKVR